MTAPGSGLKWPGPRGRLPVWIVAGLVLDAALWTPVALTSQGSVAARLAMVTVLCWSHLYCLPVLFLSPGRSLAATILGLLKGAFFVICAILIGSIAGFAAAFILGMPLLLLAFIIAKITGPVARPDVVVLSIWLDGCVFLGGIAAASAAAVFAQEEPHGPFLPKIRYITLSGAIASTALMPIPHSDIFFPMPEFALYPRGTTTQSYLALMLIALPGLVLSRPASPSHATGEPPPTT
jgi:hypothetical protein